MQLLIDALAGSIQSRNDRAAFEEALLSAVSLDLTENGEVTRVAIGAGQSYIEITDREIAFVSSEIRVTLDELRSLLLLAESLKQLLPEGSEGTDEDDHNEEAG